MRSVVPPALALALALAGAAAAGTPEAPELADAAGDCAVPYGNAYMDIIAAWISDESDVGFVVNLALASFDATLAESTGYTVQFSHQGISWGVVATYTALQGGWSYATGQARAEGITPDSFEAAEGAFADNVVSILFPKPLFPHEDPTDVSLKEFYAASADLRPAFPLLLADGVLGSDTGNGRWVTCDEGAGDLEYVFGSGEHSTHAAAAGPAAAGNATAEAADDASLAPAAVEDDDATPAPAETPLAPGLAAAALALVALAGRRRRPRV